MKILIAIALYVFIFSAIAGGEDKSVTQTIQDVKAKYVDQLMVIEGVNSVGIGKNTSGEIAIIIGVVSKETTTQSKIPAQLEGFPVETQVIGTINSQ